MWRCSVATSSSARARASTLMRQYGHHCPRLKTIATGPSPSRSFRRTRRPCSSGSKNSGISSPTLGAVAPASLSTRRLTRASRSEEHTSELQSLMRTSYAVFCLKNKNTRDSIDRRKQEHNATDNELLYSTTSQTQQKTG